MKLIKKLKNNWLFAFIFVLAIITRFGGLTWCFPYSPHPDEWNMASAITRLNWQKSLNPYFFAYGQFPLYFVYFFTTLYNLFPWIKIKSINALEATFFLRFLSAITSVGLVYLVYIISKKILPKRTLVSLILAVFTPGLIQISHFGTTESLLSFFFFLIIFFCLKILEKPRLKYYVLTGIFLGLAVGTKISALVFGFPVLITFILLIRKTKNIKDFFVFLGKYFLAFILMVLFTVVSSPFLILAFKESRGALFYETSVAVGQILVFYTRQFVDTKPVVFQLQKIFPYALGWPIFIFGTFGIFLSIINLFKKTVNQNKKAVYFLLISTLGFYFFSQAFLFTKWTRFVSPIFAFFPLFAGIPLSRLGNLKYITLALAIFPGVLFLTVYFLPNIRFTASEWIYKNIPADSQILYDTGNVVDLPIRSPNFQFPISNFSSISFDFYHLDETSELFPKLLESLESADYIIVPSRRIFSNHLRFPEKFPLTVRYYQLLFSGELGFTPVVKIEPIYSQIFKDEQAEETFSVFDHPTVRVYKKNNRLNKSQYETLFKN